MIPAVVMAAGLGTRLRPLTERWAKPVLPVDGVPVIATLLRALADAGCPRVTVVTGHLADQVERLLGDGSAFGVEVRYASQPEAAGSADAVRRAGEEPPYLVTAADTVFADGTIAAFVARAPAAGAIALRPAAGAVPVRVAGGRVERVVDDSVDSVFHPPPPHLRPTFPPGDVSMPGPWAHSRDLEIDPIVTRRLAGLSWGESVAVRIGCLPGPTISSRPADRLHPGHFARLAGGG